MELEPGFPQGTALEPLRSRLHHDGRRGAKLSALPAADDVRRPPAETLEPARQLRERGLRITEPRLGVLRFLTSSRTHPTAEEILHGINSGVPVLSRASVYNVLRTLCRAGLAREVAGPDATVRYDANTGSHHHFVCTGCGAMEDVPWEQVTIETRDVPSAGRRIESVTARFEGLCARCQAGPEESAQGLR